MNCSYGFSQRNLFQSFFKNLVLILPIPLTEPVIYGDNASCQTVVGHTLTHSLYRKAFHTSFYSQKFPHKALLREFDRHLPRLSSGTESEIARLQSDLRNLTTMPAPVLGSFLSLFLNGKWFFFCAQNVFISIHSTLIYIGLEVLCSSICYHLHMRQSKCFVKVWERSLDIWFGESRWYDVSLLYTTWETEVLEVLFLYTTKA